MNVYANRLGLPMTYRDELVDELRHEREQLQADNERLRAALRAAEEFLDIGETYEHGHLDVCERLYYTSRNERTGEWTYDRPCTCGRDDVLRQVREALGE